MSEGFFRTAQADNRKAAVSLASVVADVNNLLGNVQKMAAVRRTTGDDLLYQQATHCLSNLKGKLLNLSSKETSVPSISSTSVNGDTIEATSGNSYSALSR